MRRHKWYILLYLCMITFALTGCWDNRDIAEMSFATAVGLDKTEDNQIELTVQIVRPSAIQSSGQGNGDSKSPVWVYSATGDTVFEAFRNTYIIMSGRLFINQVQLLVIGEELAKDNILENLDFFERESEINVKLDVAIAKGITAKELLSAETQLINIPTIHIINTIDNNSKAMAKTKRTILFDLLVEMSKAGQESIVTTIEKVPEKQNNKEEDVLAIKDLKVEGTAVFKGPNLIGWLDPYETRGVMFVEDEVKSTIISVPNPVDQSKHVAIEVLTSKCKKDVQIKEGDIILTIEVEEAGTIAEQRGTGNLTTPEMIENLEKETEKVIEKEIRDALKRVKTQYKSDIFGFGEIVRRKYTDYWKDIKNEWDEKFSTAQVEIKVISKLKRTGYIAEPTQDK